MLIRVLAALRLIGSLLLDIQGDFLLETTNHESLGDFLDLPGGSLEAIGTPSGGPERP